MAETAFIAGDGPVDSVATITLARPSTGNKLGADEVQAVGRKIRELGSRSDVRLVVLRAQGEHFCLGRALGPGPAPTTPLGLRDEVADPILDFYAEVRATPVPVLAVVQGDVVGFGCAAVGICDLAIAADSAWFSMPEMEHNLPPTLAISAVLGKVPPKRLLDLVLTRRRIPAAEALALGLLSEVVPRAALDAAASATIAKLADRRRAALCAVKEYLNNAPHTDPAAASRYAASLISMVLCSPEA
jgi:enoyl-CoA hydratase